MTTVLHVPFSYAPDPMGGTEIHVAGLAAALARLAVRSVIAAPARADGRYEADGFPVYRFAASSRTGLAEAWGEPDHAAAAAFRHVLEEVRPDVVHLHAHTSAVSSLLLDEAHRAGAATVATYHTPTFSCLRGTLLHMGRDVCDGTIRRGRCAACTLSAHGAPSAIARAAALLPPTFGRAIGHGVPGRRIRAAAAILSAADGAGARFARLMAQADRVVAPATWVREVLHRNGVPPQKTVVIRQGLAVIPKASGNGRASGCAGPLRIGFFGRLSPTKGIDTLTRALTLIREADVTLEVTGVEERGNRAEADALQRAVAADGRISMPATLPPDGVVAAMRRLDVVAVPSRWLETGPLVVLEAFAAGTPVLGSRLGGIAELVSDGVDGVLLPPDDPPAWASAIAGLAEDRGKIEALRAGVRQPRTMAEVADEMVALYRGVIA